jgi:hypothetical protein
MMAPLSRVRVALCCGARVVLAISRTALAESLANVRDDKWIISVGSFLGKTKIDELPQLLNVLAGSMSLVGPRPEVPEFMKFYTPDQRAIILSMRPGITDYAAILFRDESSLLDPDSDPVEVYRHRIMPIKFAYYERYSREIGVLNDLRIILATMLLACCGSGTPAARNRMQVAAAAATQERSRRVNFSPPIAGGAHPVSVELPAIPLTRIIRQLIASQVATSWAFDLTKAE